ncbi:MAG: methyltransferase family protein [Anaerovoracaceae bacterium]|jgi:protein-S-isoprenylcysteine O-methyltransferase Ste14
MRYQLIAAAILLVFYGCYFTKMILQKRRGIQTDQIGRGKDGRAKHIELWMKAAACAVPVIELCSIILNTAPLPLPARILGIPAALAGDAIFVASALTMRDSWRAGVSESDDTELVTGGIYSISRNPAFLGFDLVYLGILLLFFNWVLLAVSVLAMVMFHLQIVYVEEAFLGKAFGSEYAAYRQRVNRCLGRKR